MRRHCDGTDPNLIRHDPPWDPSKLSQDQDCWGNERPCDCGRVFDDVYNLVIYPHPPVGGSGLRMFEVI